MSSLKDLLQEERDAESLLKDAEQKTEAILREARAKAEEILGKARSDDALVKELTDRSRERTSETRAKILSECRLKAAEEEETYKKNLQAAVKLVVDSVLGVGNER